MGRKEEQKNEQWEGKREEERRRQNRETLGKRVLNVEEGDTDREWRKANQTLCD